MRVFKNKEKDTSKLLKFYSYKINYTFTNNESFFHEYMF